MSTTEHTDEAAEALAVLDDYGDVPLLEGKADVTEEGNDNNNNNVDDLGMGKEERDKYIGRKVAKDFGGETYLGEIKSTDFLKGKNVDLFKVVYRDGDKEDLEFEEIQEALSKYDALQDEMWEAMINLTELDASAVKKLQDAGITSMSQLELFGGVKGDSLNGLDLPLLAKQQLHIIATYLLNDGILKTDSKLEDMARFNQAIATGSIRNREAPHASASNGRRRKRAVIKKKPIPKKKAVGARGRGRPPKFPDAVPKAPPPKPRTAPKKRPAPPSKSKAATKTQPTTAKAATAAAAPKPKSPSDQPKPKRPPMPKSEVYNGPPPAGEMEGVEGWPLPGWLKISKQRHEQNSVDHSWISPGGKSFRSKLAVRKFLKALKDVNGDEEMAYKTYEVVVLE